MGRDQNDNAARIVARGAGIRLPPDSDAPSLRQALSTLLGDPSYAQAADDLGQAIAISEPGDVLAASLERLTAQGRRSAAA
jgi:UDP:flavonoid glycosyltransferase YjiC (YdhE family)